MLPSKIVVSIGEIPGWRAHACQNSEFSIFKLHTAPSLMTPWSKPSFLSKVFAGLTVTADKAIKGSKPHLCTAMEPINGSDKVLQLGLKSLPNEN